jgi:hypothetical protein
LERGEEYNEGEATAIGRSREIVGSEGPALFEKQQTDGLPSQPWSLSPNGAPGANDIVQIPACPLFKKNLQLYDNNASPSTARRLRGFVVRPEATLEEDDPRPQLKLFHGLRVFTTTIIFVGLICFTIIAISSKFKSNESTQAQRGWTMS